MKIILKEKIGFNKIGDIITVKNGYAKNYLIPKEKALLVNKKNILIIKKNLKNIEEDSKKNLKNINNTCIIISAATKKNDELYVAIKSKKLSQLLKKLNLNLNETNFLNKINIIKLGKYKIDIKADDNIAIYLTIIKVTK